LNNKKTWTNKMTVKNEVLDYIKYIEYKENYKILQKKKLLYTMLYNVYSWTIITILFNIRNNILNFNCMKGV
jgi:hypothetical protein